MPDLNLTQEDIARMIADSLADQRDEIRRETYDIASSITPPTPRSLLADTGLEKVAEMFSAIDAIAPLIEGYGPALIKRVGPSTRVLTKAIYDEMKPLQLEIAREEAKIVVEEIVPILLTAVREEARIVAKELVSEFFAQLGPFVAEMDKRYKVVAPTA